jgi:conjugative transfer region protein TrbK
MRGRLFNLRAVARAAGLTLVAVAIVATAIHLGRDQTVPRPARTVVLPLADPLVREIKRCEALDMAAEQDAKCEAAWAENRRRFFTYHPADSGSRATQTSNRAASKAEGR